MAEQDGRANANRARLGSWETFTVEDLGGPQIALKSIHQSYLVASKLNGEINSNRCYRAGWETFDVEFQGGNTIALKTFHGFYVVAEIDGGLVANRTQVGDWEKFRVECIGRFGCNQDTFYIM